MTKSKHKGISRIDQESKKTHGWYVRVRLGKATRSKFFNDQRYGGREQALQKAIDYRNQQERELGKPRTDYVVVGDSPRNSSGVIGVRRAIKEYKGKDGHIYHNEVYEVSWNANRDKMGRTSVSIKKYGEAEAFRRACLIRRRKEREMYGAAVAGKWAASLSKLCAA